MTRRVTMSPMAVNVDRVDIPVRKVLIGSIAVDSATLVIADPSYLDRQWIKGGDVEPYALNCLGKDVEPLVTALRSLPVTGQVESMPGGRWYRVLPAEAIQHATFSRMGRRSRRLTGGLARRFRFPTTPWSAW